VQKEEKMLKEETIKITRVSQSKCIILLGIILLIFLIENLNFIKFNSSSAFIYIVKPIMWALTAVIVFAFPKIRHRGKVRLQGFLRWWTMYLAVIYIVLMMAGGLINGLGKSPYDHSLLGITKNIIIIGAALIGRELNRAYLINSVAGKNPFFTMTVIAVLMTLVSLPMSRINDLRGAEQIVQYIGEYVLPELSKNMVASYLVYIGGPVLSIIYLGIIQGFFWFSPILPNLKWITTALIGTLCPIFSLMFIEYMYLSESKTEGAGYEEKENPLGWVATVLVSVFIVWFSVGVFPVYPTVIATGSMKPMINPGDMVLVKKTPGDKVKVGDVIQFKRDKIYIHHRIMEVVEEKEKIKYLTKGDNNSVADSELVNPEDVRGVIVCVIPKVGWPTLLLKGSNKVPKEQVEF
jgi:signal peptidase I